MKENKVKDFRFKNKVKVFIGLFIAFIAIFGIILPMFAPSKTKVSNVTAEPKATPTDSPELARYKAEINPLIDQFNAEVKLIDEDKSKMPYATDPVYLNADKVFREIDEKMQNVSYVPDSYMGHHVALDWVTSIMADCLDDMVNSQGRSVNGWVPIGIKTAEDDMKIAQQFKPSYSCDYADYTYSGYACLIDSLQNIGTGNLQ